MKLNFDDVHNAMTKYNLLPGSFTSVEGDKYEAHSALTGKPHDWLTISFASPAGTSVEILAYGSGQGLFNVYLLMSISVDGAAVAKIADTKDLDNAKLRILVEKALTAFRNWVARTSPDRDQLRLTSEEEKGRQDALNKL